MPFSTDRRRVIALMGLVFAGLPRIRPVQAEPFAPEGKTHSPQIFRQRVPPKIPPSEEPMTTGTGRCATPPKLDEQFRRRNWGGSIVEGEGQVEFSGEYYESNFPRPVYKPLIFKTGERLWKLYGRPKILFGRDKELWAQFLVSTHQVFHNEILPPSMRVPDEVDELVQVERWTGRTIRLFAGDQEIGRFTIKETEDKHDKLWVEYQFGGRLAQQPLEKLMDPLRRGVPIKASVVVDAREIVFLDDFRPALTEEVLDELQRRTLQQLDVIAARPKAIPGEC